MSMPVIGILSFWLNGCAHQTRGSLRHNREHQALIQPKSHVIPKKTRLPAAVRPPLIAFPKMLKWMTWPILTLLKTTINKAIASISESKIRTFWMKPWTYCQLAQDYWLKGQLENALSALDQAYALIIKVDTFNRPRLIQQKEDLRYLITRRIQDIYGSRNVVAKGSLNAIPMVMNDYVKAEIESLTTGCEKDFFINSYQRSGRYRQIHRG